MGAAGGPGGSRLRLPRRSPPSRRGLGSDRWLRAAGGRCRGGRAERRHQRPAPFLTTSGPHPATPPWLALPRSVTAFRLLVVEDDEGIRSLLLRGLGDEGFEV